MVLAAILLAPAASLAAQVRVLADPMPPSTPEARFAGARLMHSGVASQFDSVGTVPMAVVGDPVTVYLFGDGEHMSRVQHAVVKSRKRFEPPVSWRAACDEIAHAGWFYDLAPASRAPFAVIVPGTWPKPAIKPLAPAVRDGAWQFFQALADTSYTRYKMFLHPATDRAVQYAFADFWGPASDGRYSGVKMFGVRGPNGHNYAAFSFAFRDDYPNLPNTARTWIVDAWGYPVATIVGNIDLYGTVDDNGIDAIVSSSGLIRWNGTRWQLPKVYSEEPCLYHKTMPLPAGAHP
jgi:hypothetical protein